MDGYQCSLFLCLIALLIASRLKRQFGAKDNSSGVGAFVRMQVFALILYTCVRTNATTPHGHAIQKL